MHLLILQGQDGQMDNLHPGVVILALLAAVPLQYYLSPSATSDLKYYLQRVTDSVMKTSAGLGLTLPGHADRFGEEKEKVDPKYEQTGYFAGSQEIRERAPGLLFRLGDVVRHKENGYRAAVVGWDLTAKAPKEWLQRVHQHNKHWTSQPNYAILVDERDRAIPQLAYVPQEKLQLAAEPINHFLIKNYFNSYDRQKARYVAKPSLQRVYPDD